MFTTAATSDVAAFLGEDKVRANPCGKPFPLSLASRLCTQPGP